MPAEAPRSRLAIAARWCGFLAAAALMALLVYGVLAQSPDSTIDDALARAETVQAEDFELDVLQRGTTSGELERVVDRAAADGTLALSELRGTPVVLNFWASWCEPCRIEAPVLERGWQEAQREGVLFLGLDMQDATEDAREFLREFEVSYPNVREAGRETARSYGATGLPETYFISARGQIVGHVIGAINTDQLRAGVAAARAGRPLAHAGRRPSAHAMSRVKTRSPRRLLEPPVSNVPLLHALDLSAEAFVLHPQVLQGVRRRDPVVLALSSAHEPHHQAHADRTREHCHSQQEALHAMLLSLRSRTYYRH